MSKKTFDWLAVEIIAIFENLGFDQAYVDDKRHFRGPVEEAPKSVRSKLCFFMNGV